MFFRVTLDSHVVVVSRVLNDVNVANVYNVHE